VELPLRPALRSCLEPVPVRDPELGLVYLLRDPFRLAEGSPALPPAGLLVASLLDGTRSLREVAAEISAKHGVQPPLEQLQALVRALAEACLLEGPHVQAALAEFLASPVREAACVGSYPGEPVELRRFLTEQWTRAGGPGGPPRGEADEASLRAVVSPHIDPHRGGHTYAWAWRAVAESCPADLFVIFGTSHTGTGPLERAPGPAPLYALTRKTFETPLGDVEVDLEVLERLLASYEGPDDLFAGEIHHRGEHSIEFQVLYLKAVLGHRPLRILPILCGGLAELADLPSADPRFQAFHAALRAALAPLPTRRVCFVAGIDLAHVGEQFGGAPVDEADVAKVAEADRVTLGIATERRCPDAVHQDISRGGDPRNICGHHALVALLESLRGEDLAGEVLHYDAWHDGVSAVSFVSAVYREVTL
jgi:AmmeMemoRadiSam system protein B